MQVQLSPEFFPVSKQYAIVVLQLTRNLLSKPSKEDFPILQWQLVMVQMMLI